MTAPEQPSNTLASIPTDGIDRNDLMALFDAGRLSRPQLTKALAVMRNEAAWARFARAILLSMGFGLIVSGIGFIVAANWTGLTPLDRLHLGIGAVALVAVLGTLAGDTRVGRSLIVVTAGLIGPLLALFGQTFQTGAEAWLLFAGWSVMILPWAITTVSPALWLLWLMVFETAVYTFLATRIDWNRGLTDTGVAALCAAMTVAALVLREYLVTSPWPRLAPAWGRLILLAGALLQLSPAGLDMVFDTHSRESGTVLGFLMLLGLLGGGGYYYRLKRPDLPALAMITLAAAGLASCIWGRLVSELIKHSSDAFIAFWMMGGGIIAIFAGAAVFLRNTRLALRQEGVR